MSLIILEGADGSGKSTLLKRFVDAGAVEIKSPERNDKYHDIKFLEDVIHCDRRSNNNLYVMDRSFLTDVVYRYVDDDKPMTIDLLELLQIMERRRVIIIYCKTNNAFENSIARGEDFITNKDVHNKIVDCYDYLMFIIKTYSFIKVIDYDFTNNSDYNNILKNFGLEE